MYLCDGKAEFSVVITPVPSNMLILEIFFIIIIE